MVAEAERVKPRSMYVEEAIQAALESRWQDALSTNRALMERHGPDDDTYNRIGKALTELGEHQGALEAYSLALQMNPLNPIAQKNVRKLQMLLESREKLAGSQGGIDVDLFAEEPGKSALTVLSPPKAGVSTNVAPGDLVELHSHNGGLQAQTARGVVLGDVDSKIARRLLPLIASGNKYTAAVARVEERQIEIIVREAFQSSENARKSSFPISRQRREEFRPYAKESLLSQRGLGDDSERGDDDDLTADGGGGDEMEPTSGGGDDFEEAAALEEVEAEDVDEDTRPEDHY